MTNQSQSIERTKEIDMTTSTTKSTQFLGRPEGRIAYEVAGEGPLVVLLPGMGDLRTGYRFLAPALQDAGYRVASTDLRGHGDSDVTFASYGDVETADDITALIGELGGSAVVVGQFDGSGLSGTRRSETPPACARTRAHRTVRPQRQDERDPDAFFFELRWRRCGLARAWKSYMPKLYAGERPADFETYRSEVVASLRRPGYAKAFSLTTHTNHDGAETHLGDVKAPTLVIMGEKDPDFPDPQSEAEWIAQTLHGQAVMVPDAGHYPQSQRPDITTDAVLHFLKTSDDR